MVRLTHLSSRPHLALLLLTFGLGVGCAPAPGTTSRAETDAEAPAAGPAATTAARQTPATGHDIHVMAPHVVEGEVRGPFHHYCKVISPEPIIQCLIYESEDPAAPMTEVEYIVAKTVTRTDLVSLEDWNRNWHDHAQEIATGRVTVMDVPPEKQKEIADIVATTDGIIFHLWPHGSRIPTGHVSIAQSVGHEDIPAEEKFMHRAPSAE